MQDMSSNICVAQVLKGLMRRVLRRQRVEVKSLTEFDMVNKKAVLSQGNHAMQRVFAYTK